MPADPPHVGTLNEQSLHAALKAWYAGPDARFEVAVDGYVIDIVQGERLVEIQTGNFPAIKHKLAALTAHHSVRLVYPIAQEKWIVKTGRDGRPLSRRKSPRRGVVEDVFRELVSFPQLLASPNFSLEVALIQEEESRRYDGRRGWRRGGWVTDQRRLLSVVEQHLFEAPADMAALLPESLDEPFTTADLAAALGRPRWLAQKMAYCLREMGAITAVGRRRHTILYARGRGER